jgi:hypothetical protein
MKKALNIVNWMFLISLFSSYLKGQTHITFSEYLTETRAEHYQWSINGVSFRPTKGKNIIYPNIQGVDTILFWETVGSCLKPDTIFSKIHRNQEYLMTIGCCDEGFDMHRIKKKNISTISFSEEISDSLVSQEHDQIKFIVLNKPNIDTLICIYGSIICLSGQMITSEKDSDSGRKKINVLFKFDMYARTECFPYRAKVQVKECQ